MWSARASVKLLSSGAWPQAPGSLHQGPLSLKLSMRNGTIAVKLCPYSPDYLESAFSEGRMTLGWSPSTRLTASATLF